MDVILLRYEIVQGQTDELREWFIEVHQRESEVMEIIEREQMLTESIFLEENADVDYLIWYMETPDIENVWETYEDATDALIAESQEIMERAVVNDFQSAVSDCECLFHATQGDRPPVVQ